ncbi:hypothetical protein CgunFtcFv8_023431 [Champsocephalus gunnari]|uniref:Uncharacterized protein n=1 Tax=Champsocephalus gunnari TaxID=52237 RepID=A0AAN8DCF1_CHAGU|nr:hypothetical protein CgunFtcFv8_023431 [Champsocephalus gunnari]
MNKPPQPIAGSTSVPNPSPSPGLTQAAYGPGQPPSLVFATPPPQQMNSAPQPRQSYYQNRPAMAASAPRLQTSSGPPTCRTHSRLPAQLPDDDDFPAAAVFCWLPSGILHPPWTVPGPIYASYSAVSSDHRDSRLLPGN